MSNLEVRPEEITCEEAPQPAAPAGGRAAVEILSAREVPLGGPRAMTVRRTLPQRQRSLIGAWCFVDHYGPDDVSVSGGMDVPPHPHTGLQTVSWLFTGEIEHRDSIGTHELVRPGELNLMTAGHGICHSEVSTPDTTVLHGVQLWVALPAASADTPRDFQHYVPDVFDLDSAMVRVFVGSLAGHDSPVPVFSPLLGAELLLDPAARVTLPVDPGYEHGLLVDTGTVQLEGTAVGRAEMGYVGPGPERLTVLNTGPEQARLVLLGGEPFGEEIIMWWNLIGRSHDDIVAFREDWQRESDRFGRVLGYRGRVDRLPAPPLPNGQLRPRRNPSG